VGKEDKQIRRSIGILTESPGLYDRLSAERNLTIFADLYEVPPETRDKQVKRYLEMMGLWERRSEMVAGFSKGMKQKMAIVRALIHEPKVVFLDEPTHRLIPRRRVWCASSSRSSRARDIRSSSAPQPGRGRSSL